jgi:two-component system sensor histidine kinase PilS (NtrC family)
MTSGVLTTDHEGIVTYANPAALELLAHPAVGILGASVEGLGLLDDAAWRTVRSSHAGILRWEGNISMRGPDVYFGVSVTALRDDSGRTTGRIFIFQNLTDLKRLEGEVRLKEKMAAVGELAAGIAHEIRNPLASISGSAQVLRGSSSPGSSERRLMEIVVQESQRLSSILEDFLKYVKPRERVVEPVDAAASRRDVALLLENSDERLPGHEIKVDLDPPSVVLPADAGQLRQIFWNLARNALAAMPDGGRLTILGRLDGSSWVASLRDEGRGMSAEERDRLFTPFAHSFRGGSGLGLAIVYRIVEEHGGTIRVDTTEGHGTTISISLPVELAGIAQREVA